MTWDIVNSHIKLNCKTDNLQFKVLFFDAIEREYAFCFISFPKSICQAHFTQCEISQNLLTNETQLTIPLNNENGNSKWTCRHGYNYEEATVHVQLDEKHDIITPEIRTKQTWPFEDGSVVELTCLARINSQAASLNWDCTDIETSTHNVVNCTHYSTKLIYTATVKDNGRVCKCIATMGTASTSTSIKLEIRKIFSLDIYHQFECNNSEEVQLSCTISSNALSFGFDSWIHTYKGVFIRHVKGTNLGNKSVLLINTCQFYDCGKYTCRAWERGENGLKWIQEGGELKVRGPPFVVDTYTVSTPVLAFAVKFVSQPTAYFLEWYTSDDVVNSSSKYNQTTTNDTFTVFMHGVPVAVAGYRATLTIRSKEEMETDEQVSLVLINELGKTSYSFKLWIAPFEETEPNIYNDIIADNEEIMSIREHHNLDIEISQVETEKDSFDDSSNHFEHYMYVD
ncbi:unnamed protein product [Mytilus coruscus]|uniref:Ig-like domain-containing protein n=1 Tax=Mytilus coruscus TaxID=42192 RepID=A0A6J8BV92_MYTCO|nr:unnamed protein product [Mytilus coruscus]